jgi:tetratricopeptide (TPR) repeat protein
MKKSGIKVRLIVLVIVMLALAYQFFTFKSAVTEQEQFSKIKVDYPKENQVIKSPKKIESETHFYANFEFADFFKDIPCKEAYFINNFFSELKNNHGTRQETLARFVAKLIEAGLFDKAIELANLIEDQGTYQKLVASLLEADDLDRAMKVANSMNKYSYDLDRSMRYANSTTKHVFDMNGISMIDKNYIHAMKDIVGYLAKKGDIDEAVEVANAMSSSIFSSISQYLKSFQDKDSLNDSEISKLVNSLSANANSRALRVIVDELLKTGNTDEALKIANTMDYWTNKTITLENIAKAMIKNGKRKEGYEILQSSLDNIDKRSKVENTSLPYIDSDVFVNGKMSYIYMLNNIAQIIAESGDTDWSKQVFEKSIQLSQENEHNREYVDVFTIEAIIEAGFFDWGNKLSKNYDDANGNSLKDFIFSGAFYKLMYEKKVDQAVLVLDKALDMAFNTTPRNSTEASDRSAKADFCWKCANQFDAKNKELAVKYYKKALEIYKETCPDKEIKDSEKESMICSMLRVGQYDWAMELYDSINPDYNKEMAEIQLSRYLSKNGQIDKSLEVLDSIKDEQTRLYTLRDISSDLLDQKNYAGFEKIFSRLLACANEYSDEVERNEFFFIISQILLDLQCEEQQKYIQKFVSAYDHI